MLCFIIKFCSFVDGWYFFHQFISKVKTEEYLDNGGGKCETTENRITNSMADTNLLKNEPQEDAIKHVPINSELFDPNISGPTKSQYCNACQIIFQPFLIKFNPLPSDKPTTWQHLLHAIRCPPHGVLAHHFTHSITIMLLLMAVYCITINMTLFLTLCSLVGLIVIGTLAGLAVEKLHLPALLGKHLSMSSVQKSKYYS